MNLIFDMQQSNFGGVTSFVCRMLRIVKIVTVDALQLHAPPILT